MRRMMPKATLVALLALFAVAARADQSTLPASAPAAPSAVNAAALGKSATTLPAAPGAPLPDSALPPLPQLDRIVYAKIHSGIVISEATDSEGHGGIARGWAVCHCSVDSVWAVLTNHAPFATFMPRVTSMEILKRTEHGERALQSIDASIKTVKYALDYSWDPARRFIEFHLVKDLPHDLVDIDGSWQLWPIDHGAATLLAYQSAVDTGAQIPGFIRSYLADRGVKDTMEAIRKRAEANPVSR